MVFYKVNAKKAKEVYNRRRLNEYMDYSNPGLASYYKLLFSIRKLGLEKVRVSYRFLRSCGIDNNHVRYLISEDILKEIEIPIGEAIGISLSNKYKTDPVHATKIRAQSIKNLEKAWEEIRGNPKYRDMYERILSKSRTKRGIPRRRRRKNVKRILIDTYDEIPERVSINDVIEILKEHPDVTFDYPKDKRRLYITLFLDLRSLGIDTNFRREMVIKSLKKKFEEDPEYRAFLQEKVKEITETRKKLYEENPELKAEADRKSAETRKKMMQEDEVFRKITMKNLAKGNPAFCEKYRTDEEFRNRVYKKQIKSLRKGSRTIKKGVKRRGDALNKWIIKPYFGDPYEAKPLKLEILLNTEQTGFRDRYYRGMSLYSILKKDLKRLREEYDEELHNLVLSGPPSS